MGYWDNAVKRVFNGATDITEDWGAKRVKFHLYIPRGVVRLPQLDVDFMLSIASTFGDEVKMNVSAAADTRYMDQGDIGVIITVTLEGVSFPEPP